MKDRKSRTFRKCPFASVSARKSRVLSHCCLFYISAKQMDDRQQPYRLPSTIHGLSHGLKIARLLAIFTPVCGLVPPFQVRFCVRTLILKRCDPRGSFLPLGGSLFPQGGRFEAKRGLKFLHRGISCTQKISLLSIIYWGQCSY